MHCAVLLCGISQLGGHGNGRFMRSRLPILGWLAGCLATDRSQPSIAHLDIMSRNHIPALTSVWIAMMLLFSAGLPQRCSTTGFRCLVLLASSCRRRVAVLPPDQGQHAVGHPAPTSWPGPPWSTDQMLPLADRCNWLLRPPCGRRCRLDSPTLVALRRHEHAWRKHHPKTAQPSPSHQQFISCR